MGLCTGGSEDVLSLAVRGFVTRSDSAEVEIAGFDSKFRGTFLSGGQREVNRPRPLDAFGGGADRGEEEEEKEEKEKGNVRKGARC